MILLSLAACSSWSAPAVVPIHGPMPRQILIMPLINRSTDRLFASELDQQVGIHVEGRGYQSIRPSVTRTLLSSYGWKPGDFGSMALPFAVLKRDHQVDAVLVTELVDWQADRVAGRYRYRLFWTLFDCNTGAEIWRYDDGGQVAPLLRQETMGVLYPEDLARGPGPRLATYEDRPITSSELARMLQRNMALRLPLFVVGGERGWSARTEPGSDSSKR